MNTYELNFAELTTKEKEDFLRRFGCASISSDFINDLFALMVYTRGLNTMRRTETTPPPEILQIANDLLWDAMKTGEAVITEELEHFQDCYQAAVAMVTNADDSYIDTPEKEEFYHKYFEGWDYGDAFLWSHGNLFYNIVMRDGESPDRIGELIKFMVESWVGECFTDLGKERNCSNAEWEKRIARIHESPVFCNVIARLQQDAKAAMSGTPVEQLRERYKTLCLFSEEELAQIIKQ